MDIYSSSHNHGSGKWIPPILVSFHLGQFSTSMIMGERVYNIYTWSPCVLCFGGWTLKNKVFYNQNKGLLGSRYIFINIIYNNIYICMYVLFWKKCGLQFFQLFNFTHHLGCLLHGFLVLACLKAFTPARVTLPLVNSETEKTSPWSVGGGGWCGAWPIKKSPKQKEEEGQLKHLLGFV